MPDLEDGSDGSDELENNLEILSKNPGFDSIVGGCTGGCCMVGGFPGMEGELLSGTGGGANGDSSLGLFVLVLFVSVALGALFVSIVLFVSVGLFLLVVLFVSVGLFLLVVLFVSVGLGSVSPPDFLRDVRVRVFMLVVYLLYIEYKI